MKLLILSLVFLLSSFNASALEVQVVDVYDGDTFLTAKGKKVRLLNINTPETAKKNYAAEPYANAAKKALIKLVADKTVTLKFAKAEKKDRYGRLLAHVYVDGLWVNEELIKQGMAHLYTFPKSVEASKVTSLMKEENKARSNKAGLWQDVRFKVLDAKHPEKMADWRIGKYQVVEGEVTKAIKIKNKVFLNFGENWREDFTVEIPKKYWKNFSDLPEFYIGKKLRIRGVLKPVNGKLITVTHSQQLEILDSL